MKVVQFQQPRVATPRVNRHIATSQLRWVIEIVDSCTVSAFEIVDCGDFLVLQN